MAWTTPRTWTAGELVTKTIMDTHVRDNFNAIGPIYAKMKAVDETVNNSSVLQNDDDLLFSVLANEKYAVELHLNISTGATPDWKANWTKPAGATVTHCMAYNNTGTFQDWKTTDLGIVSSGSGAEAIHIWAAVIVGGTAGTIQFQWAQDTANASNTIVKAGSYMIAQRIN